jgi:hypothetical protein
VRCGLEVGIARGGNATRSQPILDRPLGEPRFGEVTSKQLGLRFRDAAEARFKYIANAGVLLLAPAAEQGFVCRLLDQCVLESEVSIWNIATTIYEAGLDQLIERRSQLPGLHLNDVG